MNDLLIPLLPYKKKDKMKIVHENHNNPHFDLHNNHLPLERYIAAPNKKVKSKNKYIL